MTGVAAVGSLGAPERSAIHALATPRRTPTAHEARANRGSRSNVESRELENRAARPIADGKPPRFREAAVV